MVEKKQKEKEDFRCPNCFHLASQHFVRDDKETLYVCCNANLLNSKLSSCECKMVLINHRKIANQFRKFVLEEKK